MGLAFSFLMAVLPGLILLRYYYYEDRRKPEPLGLINKVFFYGVIAILPVFILECIVGYFADMFVWSPMLHSFLEAFIVAALCEEGFKWIIIKKTIYDNPHFDEVTDGVIYTIVASLGFACMENVLYVIGRPIHVAFLRAFTAIPLHAVCSGIMGYYIGRSKFIEDAGLKKVLIRKGIFVAVLIHGLYNFLIFSSLHLGGWIACGIVPLVVVSFYHLNGLLQSAKRRDIKHKRV